MVTNSFLAKLLDDHVLVDYASEFSLKMKILYNRGGHDGLPYLDATALSEQLQQIS
jgi:hypothetical protein